MESNIKLDNKNGSWLNEKPEIKLLDCTIRDGGLVNNFHFEEEFVRALYHTLIEMNVDYMEIGKICSEKAMDPKEYGPWNFCKEEDIRRIVGLNRSNLKIAVMADVGRTFKEQIVPKDRSVVDLIRVATYNHQIPEAIELINHAHDMGYETTVNLMAISKLNEQDLSDALNTVIKTPIDIIYVVDSFGSFYSEEIRNLTKKYVQLAKEHGKLVGIHAHNNQQLAYANTIESVMLGCNVLDATAGGLGRGAGNCPLELLMGMLKSPKYNMLPLLKYIQEYITPLRQKLRWGYDIPYMITGQLNEHPRSAINFINNGEKDYLGLYNTLAVK